MHHLCPEGVQFYFQVCELSETPYVLYTYMIIQFICICYSKWKRCIRHFFQLLKEVLYKILCSVWFTQESKSCFIFETWAILYRFHHCLCAALIYFCDFMGPSLICKVDIEDATTMISRNWVENTPYMWI